ncbi:MAG: DUF2800 domain-containing protein [Candidatus Latescibacteria bacterium]|nr:DUF2800 domain-containing protein [bacterium]MBD3423604.1 DUF2800 domain-containing protein [Candidatus Latescibacterota bacterium]
MIMRNRFGWSLSRESIFDSCRKRYYFHYYLSWKGWKSGAPEISREAFLLKRLVSLPLWRGQLVHYIATKVLQSTRAKGRIPDQAKVLDYASLRFEKQYQFSLDRRYLDTPKKSGGRLNIDWLALFEHEYGLRITDRRLETAKSEVREGLRNLIQSGMLKRAARSDPSGWIIENIDISEFAQSFELDGVIIYVKTDFIFRDADGVLNIVDWKTFRKGKDEESADNGQLGVYGYYAASRMNEPFTNIRMTEVNLLDSASERSFRMDKELMERSKQIITEGVEKLSSVLVGADTGRNEPLPPEHFPPDPGPKCRFCNFNRVCPDSAASPG